MNRTLLAFLIGLLIGLVLFLYSIVRYSKLKKEFGKSEKRSEEKINEYKKMLSDRMELENESLTKLKKENEEMKAKIDNMRISLEVLAQKPGRKELQRLDVYNRAIERLYVENPGFATVWQVALNKSEEEMRLAFLGSVPLIRRFVKGRSSQGAVDADVTEE